jgi:putative heme-binding domain-containing protein
VVKAQLQKGSMDVETLAGFAADPKIQSVLAETLISPSAPAQALALKVLAAARLKQTPDLWTEALVALVEKPSASNQEFVFETIRSLKFSAAQAPRVSKSLALFASDTAKTAKIRIAALASIPVGSLELDAATFQFARQNLPDSVEVFRKAKLSSAQLIELTNDLKKAEPLQINRLVEAFDKSSDPQVGVALVQALKSAMARSSLQIDTLKSLFKKFGPTLAKEEMELYALIDTELLKQQAKLEEMMTKMKKGDIRKGQLIFNSQKAACITCHTMGYLGGNVGPELTNIGRIRTERDLLESIVFPSASIVRSYESVKVTTSSGQTYIGILKRENTQEVVLIQGAVGETRIARTDIEEMQPSKVSIMPAGLDQQMTLEELADLVAFLKSSK